MGGPPESIIQCHRNSSLPGDDDPRWIQQRCVISHYKFYLAFENSQNQGYVTEKVWQALVMGAIPIYWGAPDIDEFLPDPDAVIRVRDFKSSRALAEYVRLLMGSSDAYLKHMKWRKKPLPESLRRVINSAVGGAACHLCDYVSAIKYSDSTVA